MMYSFTVEIGKQGEAGNPIYANILADSPTEAIEIAQGMWIAAHTWSVKPA